MKANIVLGTRGHDTEGLNALHIAQNLESLGLKRVQFVPQKFLGDLPITMELALEMGQEFAKRDIKIALLGSYFNPLDTNVSRRDKAIDRFKEYCRYAKAMGATIVGTETGSYDEKWGYHYENHTEKAYQSVLAVFKDLLYEARANGVCLGIEAVYNHVIYDIDTLARFIDDLGDQTNIKLIFDPVNLFNPQKPGLFELIIKNYIEKFDDTIVGLVHAKDFVLENGFPKKVPLGSGLMNYSNFIGAINIRYPSISVIIEEQTGSDLLTSINYLNSF